MFAVCKVAMCPVNYLKHVPHSAIRSSEEESTEMEEMDTCEPNWCWFYLANIAKSEINK